MPENQTAWNSNNQGIKEKVNQDNQTSAPRQRNMGQMKEQSKTSEIELSDKERANLPGGEFKALLIKMLTELIELGHKMKEQMKDTQNEIKQKIQGTNSDSKETRTQSDNLEKKGKIINFQPERNEETRIQKKEERLRNLWDNFKRSNI